MPTHLLRGFEVQVCLKVFWLTFWMWFSLRSGASWSCDKVLAVDVSAWNLTNTRWSNAPVVGSLRVRQPYGGVDKVGRSAINTRGQQQHLDDAIDNDCNDDFLCASPTTRWQRQLGTSDAQGSLCILLGLNRGSPHKRDTRTNTEEMRYQRSWWMPLGWLSAEEAC